SVLFGYALLGVPLENLLAAGFMAAPPGWMMAKMLIPETEKSKMEEKDIQRAEDEAAAKVMDAAAKGASTGLSLALNVGAMPL
ncbi:nucleoside transporter C-terminal domain-containing protein, partial [Bacillus sp. GbtcB13]|uniref:nucleoside transporter C-terminal domain-containing protein n=1 Tax=Bacillus sp. GbtcB13 TaxID=2824758 RepID=UPI002672A588